MAVDVELPDAAVVVCLIGDLATDDNRAVSRAPFEAHVLASLGFKDLSKRGILAAAGSVGATLGVIPRRVLEKTG